MKITIEGLDSGSEVLDADVILDPSLPPNLDLSFIGNGCRIIGGLSSFKSGSSKIMVVSQDSNLWERGIKWISADVGSRDLVLAIPMDPKGQFDLTEIQNFCRNRPRLSIVKFAMVGEMLFIEFAAEKLNDIDVDLFFAGMNTGIQIKEFTSPESRRESSRTVGGNMSNSTAELLVSFLEVLDFLDSHQDFGVSMASNNSEDLESEAINRDAVEPRAEGVSDKQAVIISRSQLAEMIEVRREFETLKEKYDRLASSRFGKLTVRAWERRN